MCLLETDALMLGLEAVVTLSGVRARGSGPAPHRTVTLSVLSGGLWMITALQLLGCFPG